MRRFAYLIVALSTVTLVAPSRADAAACDSTGTPTTTLHLPNITKTLGGSTGWVTPFIVQNVGSVPTTLEVSFYSFSSGALVTCRKIGPLQPGTSFADIPNADADLPDNSQFSVVVRSFGAPVVSVVNEHEGTGASTDSMSYVGAAGGATSVFLPLVANTYPSGWLTTFIVQNVGTANATVTIRLVSFCRAPSYNIPGCQAGSTVTLFRSIAPGRSAVVDPTVEPLISGLEYAATLTSDQPIAVVVNAHRLTPMSFSYNGAPTPTQTTAHLPYVARDADDVLRMTYVFIQNAGSVPARPQVEVRPIGGGATATISAPADVAPGATWVFDPSIYQITGGYQICPTAGSPTCPRTGEHSAIVSGGTFAVLAATYTPANANPTSGMAYTGPARGARLYLPNVTRTLGGTTGWTTPILLQWAGATSATLRWSRFSDGTLVTTQQLTGLSAGQAVRIDPRTVPGLSDDTQYAVTVEAVGGEVTAIVTELASTGGDTAMIYEGFVGPPAGY